LPLRELFTLVNPRRPTQTGAILRPIAWVFASCALALGVGAAELRWSPEEQAYLAQKGPLRMCVAPDWPPMESIDAQGRHVGIGAEFIALMAKRGGLTIELQKTPDWAATWALAQAGECDFLSMIMDSPEREQLFAFTTPYVNIPGVVVTRQEVPYVASIDQVLDQKLGIVRGFVGAELLRARYPGIRITEVDSYQQGLGMVQAGQLFGMLGNMASIGYLFQQNQISDLKIAGWVGSQSRMSVGTRKDDPMLGQIFQKLVDAIEPAESQTILNHWLNVRFEQGFDYELFWRTLAVLVLIGSLLGYWMVKLSRLNRQLREANDRLAEAGRHDALTGLHNRLCLDQKLPASLRLCIRNRLHLSLAMIDIDHFKQINDRFGHPFGDASLKHVANIMAVSFRRETDSSVRYGGEEFVVLIEGGERADAIAQMEALRTHIERMPVHYDGHEAALTVSIGLYTQVPPPGEDAMSVLKAADAALYRAKESGRNRLVIHDPEETASDA
jgi:polar amino acid transport system substrate-binding protein